MIYMNKCEKCDREYPATRRMITCLKCCEAANMVHGKDNLA